MTHRFINADGLVSTGTGVLGYNMFAYCENNPVNCSDSSGIYATYAGVTYDGIRFSHVPIFRLGYYGQIKEYHIDGEIIPETKNTSKSIHVYHSDSTPSKDVINNYNNVVVFDNRYSSNNPSMQIFNSYKITDEKVKIDILNALLTYDEEHPSECEWGRSVDSMKIEWDAHNDIYSIYANERCQHVDLDHNDEGVTYLDFYLRAFMSVFGG